MKICEKCNRKYKDGTFCPNCGGRLIDEGGSVQTTSVMDEYASEFLPEKPSSKPFIVLGVCALIVFLIVGVIVINFKNNGDGSSSKDPVTTAVDTIKEKKEEIAETIVAEEEEVVVEEEEEKVVVEEEEEEEEEKEEKEEEEDYILPYSDTEVLTKSDYQNLSKDECILAINEIYARNGRKFKDDGIRAYFESKDWYKGRIDPDDFTAGMLSSVETKNINILVSFAESKGWR